MHSIHPTPRTPRRQGFTLLEVLMAVAVIGILVAIIIPAIGGAQTSAKRAKTRVQFSQWSAAIEQFRQEYGYYPNWGSTNAGSEFANGLINSAEKSQRFVECLSGRELDGTNYGTTDPGYLAGNIKGIVFAAFTTDTLTIGTTPQVQDAFGNTEIVVVMDRNLSGMITFAGSPTDDYLSAPPTSLTAANGGTLTLPFDGTTRIRAGVAFYSAGDGQTPVTSW